MITFLEKKQDKSIKMTTNLIILFKENKVKALGLQPILL